jgi:hypothetical protein
MDTRSKINVLAYSHIIKAEEIITYPKPELDGLEMFGAGYHVKKKFGWIEVVKSTKKGVGTIAIKNFEEWVRKQGGIEVRGEALQSSIEFWKKLGYTVSKKPTAKWRYPIRKTLKGV